MTQSSFKVNFFKPNTDHARANMRLIVLLATIWAISVFGFQFLLIALNKPVPEANYLKFQQLWPEVTGNTATTESLQAFSRVTLSVLGKNIALQTPHKAILQETFSRTALALLPDDQKDLFASDPINYLANNDLHDVLGLDTNGMDKLLYALLTTSIVPVENAMMTDTIKSELPAIMELYLVHNQSALTDTRFLGFPFHYWYTAQFLLILFVGLCILYAVYIDKLNKKYSFPD